MNIKKTVYLALNAYQKGEKTKAKELLEQIQNAYPSACIKAENYKNKGLILTDDLVPYGYIGDAIERIDRELGEDVFAFCPVPLCLRTALEFLS